MKKYLISSGILFCSFLFTSLHLFAQTDSIIILKVPIGLGGATNTKFLSTTSLIPTLNAVDSTKQLYIADTILGGQFNLYYGNDAVDTAIVFQDSLGRKWKRNMPNGAIDIRWFGAQPAYFDSYYPIQKAINYNLSHKNTYVYIPNINGYYYCTQSIFINGDVTIKGEPAPILMPTSKIIFGMNKVSIKLTQGHLTMSDLFMSQDYAPPQDSTAHGIELHGVGNFSNVSISSCSGDNLHIDACYQDGTNADQSVFTNCSFHASKKNGVFLTGCDANIIIFQNCLSADNALWGYYDNGFLGNTYIQCQTANNGKGNNVIVNYNGHGYVARNLSGIDNINQKPDAGNINYWVLAEGYGTRTEWDSTKKYYSGGSFAAVNPNAYNQYLNCYSEGYQSPAMYEGRSQVLGGIQAAGQTSGARIATQGGVTGVVGSLSVSGNTAGSQGVISSTNSINTQNFFGVNGGGLYFNDSYGTYGTGILGGTAGVSLRTQSKTRLAINPTNGNVRIADDGLANATERLQVDGNLALNGKLKISSDSGTVNQVLVSRGASLLGNRWATLDTSMIPSLSGKLNITDAITTYLPLAGGSVTGNLSVGNNLNTQNIFGVNGGGIYFNDNYSTYGTGMLGGSAGFQIRTMAKNRMTITPSGYVRLADDATPNANERLQVEGNISLYGKIKMANDSGLANQVLISQGATTAANKWASIDSSIAPSFATKNYTDTKVAAVPRADSAIAGYGIRFDSVYTGGKWIINIKVDSSKIATDNAFNLSVTGTGGTYNSATKTLNLTGGNTGNLVDTATAQNIRSVKTFIGSTGSDGPPLGELLSASNWTATGWAGTWGAGFTHTTGNTTPLTNTLVATSGSSYLITWTVSGRTAGTFTIMYGGVTNFMTSLTASGSTGPTAISTGSVSVTPTTDFDGTIILSIKTIGYSTPNTIWTASDGSNPLHLRRPLSLYSTYLGFNAGRRATGANNLALGDNSQQSTTTGSGNVTNGTNSFAANTTGYNNSGLGVNSGSNNTSGYNNNFIGYFAGSANTVGFNNIAIGGLALFANQTGNQNTAVGDGAGRYITGGSTSMTNCNNCTFIGAQTKAGADNLTNVTAIGFQATTPTTSNSIQIGNASVTQTNIAGQVGIANGTNSNSAVNLSQLQSATAALATIVSNSYTSSTTNITNAASSIGGSSVYMQIGNIVHVRLVGTVTPNTTGAVAINISLPIATSNGTQGTIGTVSIKENGGTNYTTGEVNVNSTSTLQLKFNATQTATATYTLEGTYQL